MTVEIQRFSPKEHEHVWKQVGENKSLLSNLAFYSEKHICVNCGLNKEVSYHIRIDANICK